MNKVLSLISFDNYTPIYVPSTIITFSCKFPHALVSCPPHSQKPLISIIIDYFCLYFNFT